MCKMVMIMVFLGEPGTIFRCKQEPKPNLPYTLKTPPPVQKSGPLLIASLVNPRILGN
jgi:hypothetical protein